LNAGSRRSTEAIIASPASSVAKSSACEAAWCSSASVKGPARIVQLSGSTQRLERLGPASDVLTRVAIAERDEEPHPIPAIVEIEANADDGPRTMEGEDEAEHGVELALLEAAIEGGAEFPDQ
jgi:hypothetical protein